MSVAHEHPHSSKVPNALGWTAKEAVGIGGCLCCVYPSRSAADLLCCEGQCLCCHNPNGSDRFPQQIEQTSEDDELKQGSAVVGWGTGFGEGSEH